MFALAAGFSDWILRRVALTNGSCGDGMGRVFGLAQARGPAGPHWLAALSRGFYSTRGCRTHCRQTAANTRPDGAPWSNCTRPDGRADGRMRRRRLGARRFTWLSLSGKRRHCGMFRRLPCAYEPWKSARRPRYLRRLVRGSSGDRRLHVGGLAVLNVTWTSLFAPPAARMCQGYSE